MQLSNKDIVQYAEKIKTHFFNREDQYLPVRLNYAIQKNAATLIQLYVGIDDSRKEILTHYGKYEEKEDQFVVESECIEAATKELDDLYALKSDVNIMTVSLSTIDNIQLTAEQMEAIMFMIVED